MENSQKEFYDLLAKQADALTAGEPNVIANLANISALLFDSLDDINWAGFYFLDTDSELVLGPFQGKPACVRIPVGRGVCGTAASTKTIQLIGDVHSFEGHIACDAASNSEIVLPLLKDGEVYAVLDIDSPSLSRFNEGDSEGLQLIVAVLENIL